MMHNNVSQDTILGDTAIKILINQRYYPIHKEKNKKDAENELPNS